MVLVKSTHYRLYTIQTSEVYYKLLENHAVTCKKENVNDDFFYSSYEWLMDQMKNRIGPPPSSDCYPLWAWYRWNGKKKPKPDLRYSGLGKRGDAFYIIELHIPKEKVLLSDYMRWHCVLNRYPCNNFEHEDDKWNMKSLDSMKATWENIFDIYGGCPDYHGHPDSRAIQATFWELKREEIKSVRRFIAK